MAHGSDGHGHGGKGGHGDHGHGHHHDWRVEVVASDVRPGKKPAYMKTGPDRSIYPKGPTSAPKPEDLKWSWKKKFFMGLLFLVLVAVAVLLVYGVGVFIAHPGTTVGYLILIIGVILLLVT